MSNKYSKVVYWDRSYRIVRSDQVPLIEQKIMEKKPFRLHHSNGVDLVQPGTVSLITAPRHDELPPSPRTVALPEGAQKDEPPLPDEIMNLLRRAIKCRNKVERKWWLEQFRLSSQEWKKSGKIEVPSKYNEGVRNG